MENQRKLKPHQSFLFILFILAFFILIQLLGIGLASKSVMAYQAVAEILGLGVPTVLFLLLTRRFKSNVHYKKVGIWNAINISSIVLLLIPLSMLLATASMWLTENTIGLSPGLDDALIMTDFSDYLIAVLVMALVPAICEELAFRTAFFSGLESLGKVRAFVFVSLFFSLAHMVPEKLLSTFVLSLFLTYFLYRTQSVFAAMIGHFVNNFAAITLSYVFTLFDFEQFAQSDQYAISEYGASFIAWGALSLLVLPVLILLLRKFHEDTKHSRIEMSRSHKLTGTDAAALLPALAIYLIMVFLLVAVNLSGMVF